MGKFNDRIEAEFDPPRKWILSRALSYQWDYDADVDEDSLRWNKGQFILEDGGQLFSNLFLLLDPRLLCFFIYLSKSPQDASLDASITRWLAWRDA